jgi:amidase
LGGSIVLLSLHLFNASTLSEVVDAKPEMLSLVTPDVLTADIETLQSWLQYEQGSYVALVQSHLAQIQKHDNYLHAMVQIRPLDRLMETA